MTEAPHFDQRDQSVNTQTNIGQVNQVNIQSSGFPQYLSVPHQLPSLPKYFMGREEEVRSLLDKFDQGATVIGLRGMGGVGKTALALVLADQLKDSFSAGQIFLDMQGTSKNLLKPDEAMAHVIRSFLGPGFEIPNDQNGLSGLYRTVLSGRGALILLDNAADHVQVEPLIPPAGSALLITSRNKFSMDGLKELDLNILPLNDACDLLLSICGRIGEHADELAKLCGSLPLALRNAAYVLKEMPNMGVASYIKRLADARKRLDLVEASFNLSYQFLRPELQRLWCMLSVFAGDFDLNGAAAVWEMENDAAEEALGELMRLSLVEFEPYTAGEGGRCRLYNLARDFAKSRLNKDESESAFLRHAKRYRDVLWNAQCLYEKNCSPIILKIFDIDRKNIQAGQKWSAINARKNFEIAKICSDYASVGSTILFMRLHPCEYAEWLNAALIAARIIENKTAEGVHLGNLGINSENLGDVCRAIEYYNQAIEIFRNNGDRKRAANNMGNLGLSYSHLGEYRKALKYHKKALAVDRECGDHLSEGIRLGNIGLAYYELGNFNKAIEYHKKALKIAIEKNNLHGQGDNLGNLGLAHHDLGKVRDAIRYYDQAKEISTRIGDLRSEEKDLSNLGTAYLDLGKTKEAMDAFKHALKVGRKIGDKRFSGIHIGNIGLVYLFVGDIKKAIKFTELSLKISRDVLDRSQECETLCVLGNAFAKSNDTENSIDYYKKSLQIAREIEAPRCEGDALCGLGKVYIDIGEIAKGKEHLEKSLKIFQNIKCALGEGNALINISLAWDLLGKRNEAIKLTKSALVIFERIESPKAEHARQMLRDWGE